MISGPIDSDGGGGDTTMIKSKKEKENYLTFIIVHMVGFI